MGGGWPLRGAACAALLIAFGCGGKSSTRPDPSPYLVQTSPENVLQNLEVAYKARDLEAYCAQLASDFTFEFDPADLGDPGVPPDGLFRLEDDSLSTRNMFRNENLRSREDSVLSVRILLTHGESVDASDLDRAGQRKILVTSTHLEVDLQGGPDGTITLQVAGTRQEIHFRRGRTAGDSLSTRWYVVDWREIAWSSWPSASQGALDDGLPIAGTGPGSRASATRPTTRRETWGLIKSHFR